MERQARASIGRSWIRCFPQDEAGNLRVAASALAQLVSYAVAIARLCAAMPGSSGKMRPVATAGVVLLACTQSPQSRIIEVQMRTMAESLA